METWHHGAYSFDPKIEPLALFATDGLVRRTATTSNWMRKGTPYVSLIAAAVDDYLAAPRACRSIVV